MTLLNGLPEYNALLTHLQRQDAPVVREHSARASQAGGCARAVYWRINHEPESNPTPLTGYIAMRIGTELGIVLAQALGARAVMPVPEAYWELDGLSGHTDLLYRDVTGRGVICEFKTVNPFAWRYLAEPKRGHLLQLQLNAFGLIHNTASTGRIEPEPEPLLRLIYLNIAAKQGEDPFIEFNPVYDEGMAGNEYERLRTIAALHSVPAPLTDEEELDPLAGKPAWNCTYCAFWERCQEHERTVRDRALGQAELAV